MFLERIIRCILQVVCLFVFLKNSPVVKDEPSTLSEAAAIDCVAHGMYPTFKSVPSSHEKNEQKGTGANSPYVIDSWCCHCVVITWFQMYSNNKHQY